jgi:hypothetical protein
MKGELSATIEMHELDEALKGMAGGKSPGPDGVINKFYKVYWEVIGADYHEMILEAVWLGRIPTGVTKGLISLLHKGGERIQLTNWRPITLLNVAYKLYAKVLQLRLQPVLMEVISLDQSTFLPMRFILDNILMTQETLEWADYSNQPLLFLKLDFSKAYDMVDLQFLFGAMRKFGFPEEFLTMVMLLFKNASATVKVNGSQTGSFDISREVRQGCLLAPYLFLIVAEVMNVMIKAEVDVGLVKGIKLPVEDRQQVIAQYADDTSLTLLGEEDSIRWLIYTLEAFCSSFGLVLNWNKDGNPRPAWTEALGITWVENHEVSKLLGTAFGLSITSEDADLFFLERINKALQYWSNTKINSTGIGTIVNGVLLSSTYFFTSLWAGTLKGVNKVKGAMTNYL